MAWYFLRTGLNAKDMFGEVAYIELPEDGLSEDEAYEMVKEKHPDFHSGSYVKSFSDIDWDVDSESFDDEDAFLAALGEVVGTSSNHAYSLAFGRVSTKDARSEAN